MAKVLLDSDVECGSGFDLVFLLFYVSFLPLHFDSFGWVLGLFGQSTPRTLDLALVEDQNARSQSQNVSSNAVIRRISQRNVLGLKNPTKTRSLQKPKTTRKPTGNPVDPGTVSDIINSFRSPETA